MHFNTRIAAVAAAMFALTEEILFGVLHLCPMLPCIEYKPRKKNENVLYD